MINEIVKKIYYRNYIQISEHINIKKQDINDNTGKKKSNELMLWYYMNQKSRKMLIDYKVFTINKT